MPIMRCHQFGLYSPARVGRPISSRWTGIQAILNPWPRNQFFPPRPSRNQRTPDRYQCLFQGRKSNRQGSRHRVDKIWTVQVARIPSEKRVEGDEERKVFLNLKGMRYHVASYTAPLELEMVGDKRFFREPAAKVGRLGSQFHDARTRAVSIVFRGHAYARLLATFPSAVG